MNMQARNKLRWMADIDKIETNVKRRITYFYHPEVGNFHYGPRHPMKPQRLAACTNLVVNYELDKEMEMREASRAEKWEMERFHSREYIDFLEKISPKNAELLETKFVDFCIGDDCPVFDGIFDFCSLYSGASLEGASLLNQKESDIVINWSGGLHHAKKSEASGFCYVNDIVLAILELLKYHQRVLYIDIDIHHGDGVQEAFEFTDRVMTVSFHKYGEHFFPGTGNMYDIGHDQGKLFSVNVPFAQGIVDEEYLHVFKPVIQHVMDCFQPEAIVLQCGADSLGGDRLGNFNLSFDGHGDCVRFMRDFNVPLMVLGGGGYTLRNVARCWANETGILCGKRLKDDIPDTAEYMKFFEPEFTLRPSLEKRHEDQNTQEFLQAIREYVCENLRRIQGAPSVQMQPIPADCIDKDILCSEIETDPDSREDNSNDHLLTTTNGV